jgi:hypothetical protein
MAFIIFKDYFMKWPSRYFSSTWGARTKALRVKELLRRRRSKHPRLAKTDTMVKPRRSSWTMQFHRTYPGLKFDKQLFSKKFKISKRVLDTVYDRGLKAWQMGGSRPGATAQQWAIARVYKFILISKGKASTKRVDPNKNLRL